MSVVNIWCNVDVYRVRLGNITLIRHSLHPRLYKFIIIGSLIAIRKFKHLENSFGRHFRKLTYRFQEHLKAAWHRGLCLWRQTNAYLRYFDVIFCKSESKHFSVPSLHKGITEPQTWQWWIEIQNKCWRKSTYVFCLKYLGECCHPPLPDGRVVIILTLANLRLTFGLLHFLIT